MKEAEWETKEKFKKKDIKEVEKPEKIKIQMRFMLKFVLKSWFSLKFVIIMQSSSYFCSIIYLSKENKKCFF